MNWEFSLAGLLVGALVGLTGMGGGSLMAPLLIVVLGVPTLPAVGSGLLFSGLTKVIGGWQHTRLRTVDFRLATWLALGSVPASVLGATLFARLVEASAAVEGHLTRVLGAVLLLVAVSLLMRPWLGARGAEVRSGGPPGWLLSSGGALVGAIAGITSVGSGTLTTALLSLSTRTKSQRVVGTVVFHAMLLTFAAGLTHLALGEVDLALTGWLLVGSIPGVVLGSRITTQISGHKLEALVAFVMLFLGLVILTPKASAPGAAQTAGKSAPWPAPIDAAPVARR